MGFPRMYKIRQKIDQPTIVDIPKAVRETIRQLPLDGRIKPGMRVAVTAGSRGIAEIVTITRAVVDTLKELGASPFIIPAMGSHGGGTAEGQSKILAHYGITEDTMGVPIRSSMEVVEVGRMPWGLPVAVDRLAFEADGIVAVNRIKPHTSFGGTFGSGLMKMLVIGLGILVAGGFLALDVVSLRNLAQASNHVSLARIVFGLRARLPMRSADPAEMLIAILGLCLVGSAIYWEVKARRRLM